MAEANKSLAVEEALKRLTTRVAAPRALEVNAQAQAAFDDAVSRAQQQLVEELPPVLIVALAGGTGVGKSSLINALAGADIAEATAERPTTTHIHVYHHRDVPLGGLPTELGYGARFVAHQREELRHKVIVDTPDLDSFVREHRERTRKLLKNAGLVLYVFSPEKYLEERTWSVLREERYFSASAAVLNKADNLPADELERVEADLGERLGQVGLKGVRIFKTCALAHKAGSTAAEPITSRSGIDEVPNLRGLLEHELREGDATRVVRESRRRTLENLKKSTAAIGSSEMLTKLDDFSLSTVSRGEAAGDRLVQVVAEELTAIEGELAPLATLRQHERFHGPFRAWLSLADFMTIGLSGWVDRLVGRPARGSTDVVARILGSGQVREVEALLREEERDLQDQLFHSGLPVLRWHQLAGDSSGEALLRDLALEVRERFETRASLSSNRGSKVVWFFSKLGGLVPAALVIGGLYVLVRDFLAGEYLGFGLFGHLLALMVLFFVALHGIVSILLPSSGKLGRGVGLAAAREVFPRTLQAWLDNYREDIESDINDLNAALVELDQILLADSPTANLPASVLSEASRTALAWPEPRGEAPAEKVALTPATDTAKPGGQKEKQKPTKAPLDPGERLLRAIDNKD